jgi:hypothetical protein
VPSPASTGPPPGRRPRALVDAEQLLVLARRVHNDAVRDTLGLRSHRLVRWLRLAGTAPMPAYFEIADPAPTLDVRSGVTVAGSEGYCRVVRPARFRYAERRAAAGHRAREARDGRDAEGRRDHGRGHPEQAKIAEDAGAVAVMALERCPPTSACRAAWPA